MRRVRRQATGCARRREGRCGRSAGATPCSPEQWKVVKLRFSAMESLRGGLEYGTLFGGARRRFTELPLECGARGCQSGSLQFAVGPCRDQHHPISFELASLGMSVHVVLPSIV